MYPRLGQSEVPHPFADARTPPQHGGSIWGYNGDDGGDDDTTGGGDETGDEDDGAAGNEDGGAPPHSSIEGYGLPLSRHCMGALADPTGGFAQTGRLDIARVLLSHGASMAVPRWEHGHMAEEDLPFEYSENDAPTHHAPHSELYDSLETGSVMWFWALCRQQFDLYDLLREHGAPVPQTNDDLKLTLLMAFHGREEPDPNLSEEMLTPAQFPNIHRSEYPARATFGDRMRYLYFGPQYRTDIIEHLTVSVAPPGSFLSDDKMRDSWLED